MSISKNTQGILWALLSTGLFALGSALAKIAVTEIHVLQILLFRQIFVFLSCLPTLARNYPQALFTKYPLLHIARLVGAFTALSCGIWAVAVLPLTTATTLGFSEVFIVTLLAGAILGEQLSRYRLLAACGGFAGVLVVIRPGFDGFIHIHALIPLLGAFGASIAVLSVRRLSQVERTATLLVYQALFVGLIAAIPLIWLWQTPTLPELLLMCSMGLVATGGQWIGIMALRLGEASVISTVRYVSLVYAAILGLLLFNETPDAFTVFGAALIIGSSLHMIWHERK